MKQLISIRVSDATKAKLDTLIAQHGTQTEVIALAIDRMYREEKGKMKIKVEFSEDSLMGPADVEEMRLDVKASIVSYKENLVNHLYDKYPNADIEVECSGHDRIQVDGMTDHDEVPWIEQAVNKVWESYQWEVYLPEED